MSKYGTIAVTVSVDGRPSSTCMSADSIEPFTPYASMLCIANVDASRAHCGSTTWG